MKTNQNIEPRPEDISFLAPAHPCNPLPFLARMSEIVQASTDNTQTKEFQSNLLIVMQQTFGQIATIDLFKLWRDLKEKY